uniref:CCHC-type domain-containing protein n=1 Tax=Manihot esculenta TaxID=3983 RepID=A0A2C9VMB4_MANES
MDIDSMAEKVAEFSMEDDDESIEIDIIPDESTNGNWDQRWALVGRFVGERFIRLHEMSQIMASNWRPGMGVSILEISPQRFLFQFAHEADIRRIVEGGPWAYENHLLVYERVADGVNPVEVSLEKAAFWIQLHHMPLGYMSGIVVKRIGSKLGDIMELDSNNFTVMLDITKPLKDHVVLKIRNGGAVQNHKVTLKFERLPTFCFRCGLIGHRELFCRRNYEADNGEVPRMFV